MRVAAFDHGHGGKFSRQLSRAGRVPLGRAGACFVGNRRHVHAQLCRSARVASRAVAAVMPAVRQRKRPRLVRKGRIAADHFTSVSRIRYVRTHFACARRAHCRVIASGVQCFCMRAAADLFRERQPSPRCVTRRCAPHVRAHRASALHECRLGYSRAPGPCVNRSAGCALQPHAAVRSRVAGPSTVRASRAVRDAVQYWHGLCGSSRRGREMAAAGGVPRQPSRDGGRHIVRVAPEPTGGMQF
jgi:hypothetical protein